MGGSGRRQFLEHNLELAPFLKKELLSGTVDPQLLDQLHSDEETKHAPCTSFIYIKLAEYNFIITI